MRKLLIALLLVPMLSFGQTHVTFYTTLGDFTLLMEDTLSPITNNNFLDLVNDEYYDGVIFHRVIDGFMIQGGDPTGTGSGGPGYTIQDEFIPGLSNVQGTISMANTGQPNSGGSQFFINLVNNTGLDWDKSPFTSKHPVFGHVVENFNVVELIGLVDVNASDRPTEDVVINSLRVTPTLSVESKTSPIKLQVFPNPVTSESKLKVEMESAQAIDLKLFDLQGKLLNDVHFDQAPSSFEFQLADLVDALPSNLYIIEMSAEDGFVWRQKLLVD
jgi:peptidylprolyl isomerase